MRLGLERGAGDGHSSWTMATSAATKEATGWIVSLSERVPTEDSSRAGFDGPSAAMSEWIAEASSAIESMLPPTHAIARQAQAALTRVREIQASERRASNLEGYLVALGSYVGAFRALERMASDGRLGTLVDAARAETENDVLEQSRELLSAGYLAAATVLCGGALEAHLRRLCQRHALEWVGDGSIAAYDAAIAQARKAHRALLYEKADSTQVVSWGQLRNEAAHSPATFKRGESEVRAMLDGVVSFLARVP